MKTSIMEIQWKILLSKRLHRADCLCHQSDFPKFLSVSPKIARIRNINDTFTEKQTRDCQYKHCKPSSERPKHYNAHYKLRKKEKGDE